MHVNDLIFKELIKRGYSLEGNTRVWNIADSKLWYLTPDQAQAYLDVEDSKRYKGTIADLEIDLLNIHIAKIITKVLNGSAINVIDIGCGDGRKAIPVITELSKITKHLRYCPVDISSYMVSKAIDNLKALKKGEVIEFKWNISDFDNLENVSALLREGEYWQNFFLFLGGTVTNFEIHEVMHEVAEAVDADLDYLLLGLGLRTAKVEDTAKDLKTPEFNNFFSKILTHIGFDKDNIEFGTRYRAPRIEWFYTIKKDTLIELAGKRIQFNIGVQILVAVTYRYTKEEVKKALHHYFKKVEFYVSPDNSRTLVLCKK